MIRHPLWAVDACTTDADHPRTANPRAWDVPETHLQRQIRALVARQREQQTPLAVRPGGRTSMGADTEYAGVTVALLGYGDPLPKPPAELKAVA